MDQHSTFPSIRFLRSPFWASTMWTGTTFIWHPNSEAPPVMGLVFDDPVVACQLFQVWTSTDGNQDSYEELRVTIVDGNIGDATAGYIVHFCCDPENTQAHATAEEIVLNLGEFGDLCRANKMDYVVDSPSKLDRFKLEYSKHHEYLLAPVTKRRDGQYYVDVQLGIIKREIHFLKAEDITAAIAADGSDIGLIQKLLRDGTEGFSS